MLNYSIISLRDAIHIILDQPVVDLGCLSARLRYIIFQKGDLIVVTEVFQQIFEALFVDVLLLSNWLSLHCV